MDRKNSWKLIIQSNRNNDKIRVPVALFNLADNLKEKEEYNLFKEPGQNKRIEELHQLFNSVRESKVKTVNEYNYE